MKVRGITERRRWRRGQTLIFLILIVVALFFVVIWNFDLHKILRVKSVAQNGGDSAALMAARWQGATLNLVGDLNLMQALALSVNDTASASAITNVQARLLYVGPMIAFLASQQAAKNNGIFNNDDYTAYLREHAHRVRHDYPYQVTPGGEPLFPPPYPNAWEEYADMLDYIADQGVAAGPDNMRLYGDYAEDHILLMIGFYEAVAGRIWCWFYHHAPTLLEDYQNFFPCWWPPLPELTHAQYINSEFFGLGLVRSHTALTNLAPLAALTAARDERGLSGAFTTNATLALDATWYCYGQGWGAWDAFRSDGVNHFPATGPVRPAYDYSGADAAIRIETPVTRLTPGAEGATVTNSLLWTAAAKPFGLLDDETPPNAYELVLPAFRQTRLIPVDTSSAGAGGSYNLAFRRHIEDHLPDYMAHGIAGTHGGCWFCRQLRTWEKPSFRDDGVEWLDENSWRCTITGGGGGGGGGSRRGH